MRIKHQLWRVSNGWLLVPEDVSDTNYVRAEEAPKCVVFKTLKEFSDQYPKRERKNRVKHISSADNKTRVRIVKAPPADAAQPEILH